MEFKLAKLTEDPYLDPYRDAVIDRLHRAEEMEYRLTEGKCSLADFASGHEYFGLHKTKDGWVFREWAPNAEKIIMFGDFSGWNESAKFALSRINDSGHWEIKLPADAIHHQDLYRLKIYWSGGEGERIPSYARRVVQDEQTKIFSAQVWFPEDTYQWQHQRVDSGAGPRHPTRNEEAVCGLTPNQHEPLIYESHVGMAQEKEGVGSYCEFRKNMLPRIVKAGYNTIQLMAIMEHPYYASFGYHVANFFAASSRFGTPEELKELIDEAHKLGLSVIIDLVHSHAVNNEVEGLSCFDGSLYQYFHDGDRGRHDAWDSRCFDYSKPEVLHFFLSNCRYWLDEFNLDGFRFDGVTSMLYYDHGLSEGFDSYDNYFSQDRIDSDAQTYLILANKLIHSIRPDAITVAEDVSGMPGIGALVSDGGLGFDYKLAMGIPDFWFKLLKETRDEDWNPDEIFRELTDRREDEKSIAYVECHDQAIVGGKTVIFELIDAEMYNGMSKDSESMLVDRGIALHKIIRLLTLGTAGNGYLNFIGNEFGHPEWVDFPREGNDWSYKYARRQWQLRDNYELKYCCLADFDAEMIKSAGKYHALAHYPELRFSHFSNQVLAFSRGELTYVFNLNPAQSFTDYPIDLPPGKYKLLFNSDEKRFGGQERITLKQDFLTSDLDGRICIRTYLPCRTAMVLKQV
jgi:1,4-alpha-glucan branching enzyme